jgi:hypothetical protein
MPKRFTYWRLIRVAGKAESEEVIAMKKQEAIEEALAQVVDEKNADWGSR